MSKQKRGREYELELCHDVFDATNGDLYPIPPGYSGNHDPPAPDVLIDDGDAVHAFELKRKSTGQEAISFTYDPDERSKDDIAGLVAFCEAYPRPTYPYLGVRFSHRQLVCTKLYMDADTPRDMLNSGVQTCPVDAKVTRANNVRVYKPEPGAWPSASDGDDASHVLDRIGYRL